ncbi:MAG: carboxypeptidase-like regulatory domain-containing protein [Bacteroidales bacterium]|nr:carboxypeptidase-like regulatory domain-containing protein [Bacteroidales bacterium]
MRISFFLFFVGIINLIAGPSYSQNTKISLSMKDATLESVLNEIEGVSEFYFLYNSRLIDIHQKVDVSAEEELIKDILNDILPDNIKYVVSDRQIVLTPAEAAKNLRRDLQQITISGKVTDASTGNPMPGVNVQVKETTFGAITDINGNYSLVAPVAMLCSFSHL